jgi:O-antigen/teichoic acid export membrane protein
MSRFGLKVITKFGGEGILVSAATGAGFALMIKVGGTGIAYLGHLVFARWMGAAGYGSYVYAMTWAKLLALLAGFGLTTGVLRFIPEYLRISDFGQLWGIVRRSRQLTFLGGMCLATVGTGLVIALAPQAVDMPTLLAGMWLIPLVGLTALQGEMILGTQNVVLARFPNLVVQPLLCIIISFAIIRASGSLTSLNVIIAFGLAALVVFLFQCWALRRVLPCPLGKCLPVYMTNKWLRVSLPLLLVAGFELVLIRADILILGIFKGDSTAGIYNVATQTATLVSFVFAAVNTVAAPMIASLYAKGDHASLQKLVSATTKWMCWPSLAITVVLLLWGNRILSLFGTEFTVGWLPLSLLAVGHLVNTCVGPVTYLMSLTGHQDISAKVFGISALLNIVLNLILIPFWGIVGAAVATMVTMMLWNVWLYIEVKKNLGIHSFVLSRA